jgi:hypothetical protein
MNELLEVLRVAGVRIGLKINVKKTMSQRLGISEDEKVTLGNEMIDQVDSLLRLLVKAVEAVKVLKVE